MKKLAIYFIVFFLVSCRSNHHFKKNYSEIDSIEKVSIRLCKDRKIPILGYTSGSITFNSKSLRSKILNSIKEKHFYVAEHDELDRFLWDTNCDNLIARNFKDSNKSIKNKNTTSNKYFINISLHLTYMTRKNIEYGAAFEPSVDIGNDAHEIKYKFVLALFKNKLLEYMDRQIYRITIFSPRNENINYEVPQKIIDSLVTKSLAEYKKRLTPENNYKL